MHSIEEINEFIMENRKSGVSVKKVSDGYHTFENYTDRVAHLFIALCRSNPYTAWKTKKHFDEENDPMFNGCFLAGINTPGGVVSYHLKMKYWDILDVPEIERGPKYDGYTEDDVNERLLTVGDNSSNKEIDREYIEELFDYITKHSSLYVPYKLEDRYSETKFNEKLPVFLDIVTNYADEHDIPEYVGMDPETYCDNRFYYNLTFDGVLVEIGMLYSGNLCYIMNTTLEDDEAVIDCEDILSELEHSGEAKDVIKDPKGLTFKPQKKDNKKENN